MPLYMYIPLLSLFEPHLLLEGKEEGRLHGKVLGVEGGVQAAAAAGGLDTDLRLGRLDAYIK